jgi:tRNA uracil 4-sulfurtransferase
MTESCLFLVRVAAEVATKSRRTRKRFQQQLVRNLKEALTADGIAATVHDRWNRIFVETADPSPHAVARLATVFGVASISAADARGPASLNDIVRLGHELYAARVRGRRFAVRARVDGNPGFSAHDIEVELGAALNPHAEVDLEEPDVTVFVEVWDREAYFFCDRVKAQGGLPLGVQGKGVCLISGGFDSAVAAWLLLKRGVALDYVFCNLGGEAYERSVVGVAKVLADEWSWGDRPTLHVVDFAPLLAALKESVTPRYSQVVLKRLMYRVAEAVAGEVSARAIVTGESLGQVSSQTLDNLRAIDEVTALPVFRPLIGLDKQEIIQRAERIGTAVLSAHVREYCAITEGRPVTRARPEAARDEETRVDPDGAILAAAVAGRKRIDLRALASADLVQPYLFATEIADGVRVVDCRDASQFAAWHYPGATWREAGDLASQFKDLDKTGRYVLYCAHGIHSAVVAELMQGAGYEAYSFKGGVRELKRYAEEVTSDEVPPRLPPSTIPVSPAGAGVVRRSEC